MIEQETRRSFSDVWQKLYPDSVEVPVRQAAEETVLTGSAILYRLGKGRGARGRKIQVGKREYWVVEKDSLEPPHLKQRQEQGRVQEPAQREKESHLERARRKAGLNDGWVTTKEAGAYVGVGPSAICCRLRNGTAEGKKVGPFWLVRRDSLVPRYSRALEQRSNEK